MDSGSGISFSITEVILAALGGLWLLFKGSVGRNIDTEDAFKKKTEKRFEGIDATIEKMKNAQQEEKEERMRDSNTTTRAIDKLSNSLDQIVAKQSDMGRMVKEELEELRIQFKNDMMRLLPTGSALKKKR